MEHHLTATECHLPYRIIQCYLLPDTSDPSQSGQFSIYLSRRDGRLTKVTCYITRWFTRFTRWSACRRSPIQVLTGPNVDYLVGQANAVNHYTTPPHAAHGP